MPKYMKILSTINFITKQTLTKKKINELIYMYI